MAKRLTRHNGRAGKDGVYKATHNSRTFNTEHAVHIDSERIARNIYWDCFRGATYPAQQDGEVSFEDVERAFYLKRYPDYLDGQHERNAKRRHTERGRSVDDLLSDEYGWSGSMSSLSNKLQRESLRYMEAVQLADALGYDIQWVRRKDG